MRDDDSMKAIGGVVIIVLLLGLFGVMLAGGCDPTYSDGTRSGELRKFSRKGLAYKSWEGTLLLSNGYVRNSRGEGGPDVWEFSVTDPALAKAIEDSPPGAVITLRYTQWLIRPLSQDSRYTVTAIRRANN